VALARSLELEEERQQRQADRIAERVLLGLAQILNQLYGGETE